MRGAAVGPLCERAGVARTALYWHFESKEGLIAEVIEAIGSQLIERIQKQVYLEGDPIERVTRLVDGWRELLDEAPELIRLPMLVQLEHGEDPSGLLPRAVARVLDRAEGALVEGLEDTLGAEIDAPAQVAWTIMALLQGAAVRQVARPDEGLDAFFDELRRTIVLVIASRLSPAAQREIEATLAGRVRP